MTRKLPIWLEDQEGHKYHVKLDGTNTPYIILRRYEKPLSMNMILDKSKGYSFDWGMEPNKIEFTFTVIQNDYKTLT